LKRTTRRAGSTGHKTPPDHDHHDHPGQDEAVEFHLSKATAAAVDAALKGLTKAQKQRVLGAIDRAAEESGEKVGRWVEHNVVGNANELLAFMTPACVREGRWNDLRAIWTFLARLEVPVDHGRLAKAVEKEHGPELAERYRQAAGQL
jgi:hypothetical protein